MDRRSGGDVRRGLLLANREERLRKDRHGAHGHVLRLLDRRPLLRRRARGRYSLSASLPPMISISSFVIDACRAWLYWSVRASIISFAFFVAASMAVICAPRKLAIDS